MIENSTPFALRSTLTILNGYDVVIVSMVIIFILRTYSITQAEDMAFERSRVEIALK